MSARAMRLRRFSLRVLTFSGRQLSWCTALMPTARCAWSKNFAAPVDMPSTFHFISWKIEFEISGRGERQKSEGQRAKRAFTPFACAPCSFGGQGRNRTADAGLFRAAYRIAEVV